MPSFFLNNQMMILLTIILFGCAIGAIRYKGISLGNSACLLVAIAAGFAGATIPDIVDKIGIVFFVYSIGIQAGPRFFHLFKGRGLKFTFLSFSAAAIGAVIVLVFGKLLGTSAGAAVGAFAGGLTSTPTLATAIDAFRVSMPSEMAAASVAYALTYPFGLIAIILFVQLIPKYFSKTMSKEMEAEVKEREQTDFQSKSFVLTNANLEGKTLADLQLHTFCEVNISRIKRGNETFIVKHDTVLQKDDIVVAVGLPKELEKFRMLFGRELPTGVEQISKLNVQDVFISGIAVVGKYLKDLRLNSTYGITITRIRRGEAKITPRGSVRLEVGDEARVVGTPQDIEKFIEVAGSHRSKLDETNILVLAMGMLAGILIGEIPFPAGNVTFKLGIAGGPLIVALTLSHFGRIGKWSVRVPSATKFFLREIGLIFFLSGIGIRAGDGIHDVIVAGNIASTFLLGALAAIITMCLSVLIAYFVLRLSLSSSLGAICGAMTSTPALGALVNCTKDDTPTISYAAAYPVATIVLTIMGQVLAWIGIIFLV